MVSLEGMRERSIDNNDDVSHPSMAHWSSSDTLFDYNERDREESCSGSALASNARQVGVEATVAEQRELLEALSAAFRALDVQYAVSTLRKIYTKQVRDFRVPIILKSIYPGTDVGYESIGGPPGGTSPSSVIFTLQCIQWCIGAQKSGNVVSFKYKMNKKISHWLLNEQARKGLPTVFVPEIASTAITVVRNIFKHVAELDLALEILQTARVPEPMEILAPYIEAWMRSPDRALAAKACSFSENRGLSTSAFVGGGARSLGDNEDSMRFISSNLSDFDHPTANSSMPFSMPSASQVAREMTTNANLLSLLDDYPNGILGSRIPIVYRDRFNDTLHLRNMKLKDLMLGEVVAL